MVPQSTCAWAGLELGLLLGREGVREKESFEQN